MRALVATPLLLGLLLVQAPAHAAYGAGSQLDVATPATLNGRADALVTAGVAGFVSTGRDTEYLLQRFHAAELHVVHVTYEPPCDPTSGFFPTCAPTAQPASAEEAALRDATVELQGATSAYKFVLTNDRDHSETSSFGAPGSLVATSVGSATFGANPKALYLSPFAADWTPSAPDAPAGPVYTADALRGQTAAAGGSLGASGGFAALLQGLRVRVTGTDAETGEAFDQTFETSYPEDADEPTRYLSLEASGGEVRFTSGAPLSAFGVEIVDVPAPGSVGLQDARGRLEEDGEAREVQGEAMSLAAPLSLSVQGVAAAAEAGQPPRLTLAVGSALRLQDALPPEDAETDTAQLVAAGAAGAGVAGLLAAAAYFWPRLRFATTALLLPLYTRIERTQVLEHEKRDEIYELIRASPGIHAHEIGEKTQIGWGTTVYHLKLLESHSLIVSKKSGRYKRFFVNTGEYTKKKDVYGALRNETAKAVADYIVNHPGTAQKDLCAALGIQPSLASWHVEKLEGVGLVKRVKDGRQVRYFAGPAWSELNVRLNPMGGAEGVAET